MITKVTQQEANQLKTDGDTYYNTTAKKLQVVVNTVVQDVALGNVDLSSKQDTLVSGTNIKTINGTPIVGSGDLVVSGGGVSQNYSTAEQALLNSDGTPLLWVDGKQIFQRSAIASTGVYITGVSRIVNVFGMAQNSSGQWRGLGNRSYLGTDEVTFNCGLSGDLLYIQNPMLPFSITVQYTKI